MTRRLPPLPRLPDPFPAAFRRLLPPLLSAASPRIGGQVERARAVRRRLSQSGTFVGHRRYAAGDDLRRLDWAAFARTGELFTKQFEEEDRRAVTLLIDLSASLSCGQPPRRLGALRLAAIVGGLALRRLDSLAVVAADCPVVRFAGVGQLPALLDHLAALPVDAGAPAGGVALALAQEGIGRVHWLSDFAPVEAFEQALWSLRRRGIQVTGWLPTIADDEAPVATGFVRVVDPETGDELHVPVDPPLLRELTRQLHLLHRHQDHLFAAAGARLLRWPVPAADDFALASYLPAVAALRA